MPNMFHLHLVRKAIMMLCCFCLIEAAAAQTTNPLYDKALADSLGSDDYGMKSYVLVILKSGKDSTRQRSRPELDSLFAGHMKNINRLADNGKLIIAGPISSNERKYRGIFVLDVKTIDEAAALVQTDPAISAGVFDVELFKWYGSAALPLYLKDHKRLEKKTMN